MRSTLDLPPNMRLPVIVGLAALALLALALAIALVVRGPSEPGAALAPSVAPSRPTSTPGTSTSSPLVGPTADAIRSPAIVAAAPHGPWTLPAGWRLEIDSGDGSSTVRLVDQAGREQEGWPVALRGECGDHASAIGPDASVFVACTVDDRAAITGLSRNGRILSGWPVSVAGEVAWGSWNDFAFGGGTSSLAVGPDGTVYLGVVAERFAIHAFAADGSRRDGWPRRLAGDLPGFTVAPDGTVVVWWFEGVEEAIDLQARRSVFTMLRSDGSTLPGWPIGSKGAASGPLVGADSTLYYVSATGKVYRHDRNGEIIGGWPYQLTERVAPSFRDDGMVRFIGGSAVVVLDDRGRDVPGWPYRTTASFYGPGCDTPGFDYAPAAGSPSGRLYLAEWDGSRASIVALESDGRMAAGWPYRVDRGWRVTDLRVTGDGTLRAAVVGGCGGEPDDTSVVLTPTGALVGQAPGTPMDAVYGALRLDGLRTLDGGFAFPQGSEIGFEVRLVNRSHESVRLPLLTIEESDLMYATGVLQTWIERLGPDPGVDCLPHSARKGTWYAAGGEVDAYDAPLLIPVGASARPTWRSYLSADLTACLPPGDYRYHVEYRRLESDGEDAIDAAEIAVTIAPTASSGPTWTNSPTPRPTPAPTPTPTGRPSPSPSPTPAGTSAETTPS